MEGRPHAPGPFALQAVLPPGDISAPYIGFIWSALTPPIKRSMGLTIQLKQKKNKRFRLTKRKQTSLRLAYENDFMR